MAATAQPNIGTKEGYALGDNGWLNDFNFLNRAIDGLVQASAKAIQAAPPGSPARGDCYIVATSGSGAWAGWDGRFVRYTGSAWESWIPKAGWYVFNQANSTSYRYKSGAWVVDDFVRVADVSGNVASADGLVCIASGNRLGGLYHIRWEGPNRVEFLAVQVSATAYGEATIKVLDYLNYGNQQVFSAISIYASGDNANRALVLTMGNRNGGTNAVSVAYMGVDGIRLGGSIAGYASQTGLTLVNKATILSDALVVNGSSTAGSRAQMNAYQGQTAAWFGHKDLNTGVAATHAGLWAWSDGGIGADAAEGKTISLRTGLVTRALVSATALDLSAGVALTGPFGSLREYVGGSSIAALYPSGVTPSAANYALAWTDDGTQTYLNGLTNANLQINDVVKVQLSASALDLKSGVALTQQGTARITTGGQGRFAGVYSTDSVQIIPLSGYGASSLVKVNNSGILEIAGTSDLPGGPYLPLSGGIVSGNTAFTGPDGISCQTIKTQQSDFLFNGGDLVMKLGAPLSANTARVLFPAGNSPNYAYAFEVSGQSIFRANLRISGWAYLDGGFVVGNNAPADMSAANTMKLRRILVTGGSYTLPTLEVGESVLIIFQDYSTTVNTSTTQKAYYRTNSGHTVAAEGGNSIGTYGISAWRTSLLLTGVQTDTVDVLK